MNLVTAIALSILAGFAYFSRRFMGDLFLERPIVLGPLTGLIMGNFNMGLLVGATLELIFMGAADIGGTVPPNYTIASVLGTAFAISSGQGVKAGLLVAIPAALLGSFFELLAKGVSTIFVDLAEKYADNGNDKGISYMLHVGNFVHFLADALPTFLALVLGTNLVRTLANNMPLWLKNGVSVAGNALPALGFALLLNSLAPGTMMPFFFIGFLISAYTKFGVLGTALLGFLIALIISSKKSQKDESNPSMEMAYNKENEKHDLLNKKDLRSIFWRSFALQSAFSFDRMQAIGFTWTLMPYLKKVYKDNIIGYKEALKRHLTFFNTHPWISGPILALTANLESRKANGEDIDDQTIQGLKSSLMGPLAAIGDSMFHGTLRPLVGGICASLALQKNVFAPLIFFVAVNIVHVYVSWATLSTTNKIGENAIVELASGSYKKVMSIAGTVGLMSVGALTGTWLNISTPLAYHIQKTTVSIQSMLDGIMPKILPLIIVLIVYSLVKKNYKTTNIMLGIIAVAFLLGAFEILG